jgi:hypothetical protein
LSARPGTRASDPSGWSGALQLSPGKGSLLLSARRVLASRMAVAQRCGVHAWRRADNQRRGLLSTRASGSVR